MKTEDQVDLLASHAMWARDYAEALKLYTQYLESEEHIDVLSSYRAQFNVAILSAVLGKEALAYSHFERLEALFSNMERTRQTVKRRTEADIGDVWQLITKQPSSDNVRGLLAEYFPEEEELLALFVSPRYARGFLKSAIRYAEMSAIPRVMKEGIFKYTLTSELYRVVGRAYSIQELTLRKLHKIKTLEVLIENPNVYYVQDENLRVVAAIQREGRILCQYSLEHPQDSAGSRQIQVLLHTLSEILSKE